MRLITAAAHLIVIAAVCTRQTFTIVAQGGTFFSPAPIARGVTTSRPDRTANGRRSQIVLFTRRLIRTYLHAAGIETGYGFFAPNVPAALRLNAELHTADGAIHTQLLAGDSSETGLRLASFLDALGRTRADDIRDAMFQFIAKAMFDEHGDASRVRLGLEKITPPTLAEFREGKETAYELVCLYEFKRENAERATDQRDDVDQ